MGAMGVMALALSVVGGAIGAGLGVGALSGMWGIPAVVAVATVGVVTVGVVGGGAGGGRGSVAACSAPADSACAPAAAGVPVVIPVVNDWPNDCGDNGAVAAATEFGAFVDPIADKTLIGSALIGLSMLGDLPWWVTVLILTRELGVTVLRLAVIRRGVIPASWGGKLKTFVQAVAIGLFVLPLSGPLHVAAVVVMAAAILLTVITGVDYVARALRDIGGIRQTAS
ncbi:CDP-diacylglycerol--glycerol-3-phosphate 3-phosphatidyltransferase [Mycobacterium tuberculosis]|nr:CDP-diacylglycerol--glycerol-3-phosphate 3-phosphatidyltransferase [Mycobacterium tuberculosis]